MSAKLSRLQDPVAVQAALDEYSGLGRSEFLRRYGFGRSRDYLVFNPRTAEPCDSKAIVGAAFGYQFPDEGPLRPRDFSGGVATVVAKLESLGFQVLRTGEDWSESEVEATVASYFEMLQLESQQASYTKTSYNAALRQKINNRSKGAVELKFQNISSVLAGMDLPFISGYKPRSNAQLLLRQTVQKYVFDNVQAVNDVVDAMEEVKVSEERTFKAVLVDPPTIEDMVRFSNPGPRTRLARKIDFAARDESNRDLGRAGEEWVLKFEHQRLIDAGQSELLKSVDWVSERLGDGAGYDILSFDTPNKNRYIEVKTTNGPHASSFVISRNELEFSKEAGEAFHLYRVFKFREAPALYILSGDLSKRLHLEPIDYRASFRRIVD